MNGKHVYLAQLKCPSNHCMLAAADEYENEEAAKALGTLLEQTMARAVHEKLVNPWCALCGARILGLYIDRTAYRTIEEARPMLKELERRQRILAAVMNRRN